MPKRKVDMRLQLQCNTIRESFVYTRGPTSYIDVSGNLQSEAIGHTQTCPQPDPGLVLCTVLQPCELGNDSLLNMVPIPPSGQCLEGPSLCKPLEFREGVLGSTVRSRYI